MEPMVVIAARAAQKVGELILNFHQNRHRYALHIDSKGLDGLVTQIDKQAEELLIETLRYSYPNHSFLGEEFGYQAGKGADADFCWVIDPLDGTHNFVHGLPHFCVSLAVKKNGITEHGVIYDPVRDETFSASRGMGARLNNRRISVGEKKALDTAFITTGHPFEVMNGDTKISHAQAHFDSLLAVVQAGAQVRRLGSAALDLAYVAAGRFDGYFEMSLKPWDAAAGALIVSEAHGAVCDHLGGMGFERYGTVFAANARLLKPLMQTVLRAWGADFIAHASDVANDLPYKAHKQNHDDKRDEDKDSDKNTHAPKVDQYAHSATPTRQEKRAVYRERYHQSQQASASSDDNRKRPYRDKGKQDDRRDGKRADNRDGARRDVRRDNQRTGRFGRDDSPNNKRDNEHGNRQEGAHDKRPKNHQHTHGKKPKRTPQ